MTFLIWLLTTTVYATKPNMQIHQIFIQYISYEVPSAVPTWFKSWMDYTALSDQHSEQYKLQQNAYSDAQGFRRIENDYMVAMGSYYTQTCGTRFKITLETNTTFTVLVSDIKADIHTDDKKQYTPICESGELVLANVLEFIVDTDVMDQKILRTGTICALGLKGNIIKIEKII